MLQGFISRMNQHHQQQPVLVMDESLSNLTSASGEASASNSSINPSVGEASVPPAYPPPLHQQEQQQRQHYLGQQNPPPPPHQPPPAKKKRSLPGHPDPDAEVIALSPKTLLATNRFMCEICNKGFQRDQNLQLHRRGHNLPWKLKQRSNKEVVRKKVYVCPETSCVHHDPSRALGDLTGIKKHFCRKHGEKKWKCDKCSKRYAVQSDWKAHSKICGTREYRCDCGTLFSRRDSFVTHRAFCDALAEETARSISTNPLLLPTPQQHHQPQPGHQQSPVGTGVSHHHIFNLQNSQFINSNHDLHSPFSIKQEQHHEKQQAQSFNVIPPWLQPPPSSSSAMMFSQQLTQTPHGHTSLDHHHKNPSHVLGGPTSCFSTGGSSSSFPSPPSPQPHPLHPHMSATALLQKAAQIGATMSSKTADPLPFPSSTTAQQGPSNNTCTPTSATAGFGLDLPSREQQEMSTSTIGIGFLNHGGGIGAAGTGNGAGASFPSSSPSMLLHDIMMNSFSSFDGDNPFAGGGGGGGGAGNDGLTRDFLGLRPLSQSDILSIAGLGNSVTNAAANASSSSTSHQEDHHNKSWQG